jgi:hypothetical protein
MATVQLVAGRRGELADLLAGAERDAMGAGGCLRYSFARR